VPGRAFEAALAVRHMTGQAAQVGGFAAGGLLVATLSPAAALALNAASFAVSALVVRLGVAERPVPDAVVPTCLMVRWWVDAHAGLRTVLGDRRRRVLGACATACLVQAQAEFVRATPVHVRGRAIGVAASGLVGVQGVAVLAGGVVAQVWGTRAAIALCGALGMALALIATRAHQRMTVAATDPHGPGRRRAGGGVIVGCCADGSPGAVRHHGLLAHRRHDGSNAPLPVCGAVGRPSSDGRSQARDERPRSPSVTLRMQMHTDG
jgi:hypothetical protein